MASRVPVDAPEGTAARPITPDSSSTSASTVGLPRESRISLATTSTIELMFLSLCQIQGFDILPLLLAHGATAPALQILVASPPYPARAGLPATPSCAPAARHWGRRIMLSPDPG